MGDGLEIEPGLALSDEMPDAVHLAVARGRHRPRIVYPPTRVHVFAAATFSLGREMEKIDSAETIAISSKERTVVDLMRFRSRVGRDLALGALRRSVVSAAMEPLLA